MPIDFPNSPANNSTFTVGSTVYTWNGYAWISSTAAGSKGQKGELGTKGDAGIQGIKGDKGDTGAQGIKGDEGIPGTAAAKGDKGDKGFVGTQGTTGAKGERVTVWKSSFAPTDTELLWYNTVDGNFLVYYNDGDTPYWVDASPTVVGDKGDKGNKGDTVLTLENAVVSNTLTANITSITTANVATLTAVNGTFTGNLTVSGTTTYINTTQLNVGDNIISLNADLPSNTAATENAGVEVNRGSSANVQLIWDESVDRWSIGNTTFYANNISTTYVNGVVPVTTGKAIAMAIVFGG